MQRCSPSLHVNSAVISRMCGWYHRSKTLQSPEDLSSVTTFLVRLIYAICTRAALVVTSFGIPSQKSKEQDSLFMFVDSGGHLRATNSLPMYEVV